MVGTVTRLGMTSDIDMQGMLDQLREIDEEMINRKETKITEAQEKISELNTVNQKLLAMKSNVLNLSLESTYLDRSVSSSNEDVLSASVAAGTAATSASVNVTQLAQKNSWLSDGVAAADTSVYVPTTQESNTGVADPATDIVATSGESMTITLGGSSSFTVNIAADTTMNDLVDQINNHVDNTGGGDNGRLVTAETYTSGGETFMRIKSDVAGGTGEGNRVAVAEDLTALDFEPPDKTLSYQIDGGDIISVTVSADTSLSGLAALINGDENNPGITAKVIDDGSDTDPYKLSIVSGTEGEDGRITFLTQLPDLSLTEQAGAGGASLNAQFTVDGINYQRTSNTISDVITGVTMELQDTGTSTVAVSSNNTQIKELIQGLVEDYNAAIQEIRDSTDYDEETEELGILARTTVRDLPHTMRNLMTDEITSDAEGEVTTMFDIGLTYNRDGTITLDESILDDVISTHPDSLKSFFLGDSDQGITGLADKINDSLRIITGGTGQIAGEKNAAETRIADLQASIDQETERLDKKYERLTQEMINLSQYMDTMESTGNFLTSQFDSIAKAWVGSKD